MSIPCYRDLKNTHTDPSFLPRRKNLSLGDADIAIPVCAVAMPQKKAVRLAYAKRTAFFA